MSDKLSIPTINIIGRIKPIRILLEIKRQKDGYSSSICRAMNITYSHGTKLIQKFEKAGIISSKHSGRVRWVRLTERGTKVANAIEIILQETGDTEFLYRTTSFQSQWNHEISKTNTKKASPKLKQNSKE